MGRDLQAIARFEGPPSLTGRVDAVAPDALPHDVARYSIVVLDLDEAGVGPVQDLRSAGFDGRIVGFYSHVDDELGRLAETAGIEAHRRGRFWRGLPEILG